MKNAVCVAVSTILFAAAATAGAQEPSDLAISADRPGFSTGTVTVPTGHLQLEAGVGFDYYGSQAAGDIALPEQQIGTAPQLLGRYGLADFAEVRLQLPNIGYDFAAPGDTVEPAWGAASVGAKLRAAVTDQVSVALIPSVGVGVETGDITAGAIGAVDVGLTDSIGLFVNAAASNYEGIDGREFSYAASAGAGFGLTDELGAYAEWHTVIEGDDAHFAEAGVTYLLTSTLQVDGYAGAGIPEAGRIYGGVGVAKLF